MHSDYIKRINKVLHYIEEHLSEELSLEIVSEVAAYSPFHLHRLFKAITNEPLNSYIIRKRIERSAMMLIHHKELSISDIYTQVGFNSNTSYTRAFSKFYGQSPSDFRKENANNFSKIGKEDSKNGKSSFMTEEYFCNITHLKNWIAMNAKIEVKELPKMNLAYITLIGEDGLEQTFHRMLSWARPKGLLAAEGSNVVRIFHDSFKVTDADKVRMSIGITVSNDVKADDVVSITTMGNGKYIVGRFEITIPEFENAWNGLFLWMNEKGYKKADGSPFEMYYNDQTTHPEKKCIVDICIPVE